MNQKDKAMNKPPRDKAIKGTEESVANKEYFFSGGLEYRPITVVAASQEEANEKWIKLRVKVNS